MLRRGAREKITIAPKKARRSRAWLANLNGRGLELRAGQLVATGQTCSHQKAVRAGDRLRADFGELGSLEMTVAP